MEQQPRKGTSENLLHRQRRGREPVGVMPQRQGDRAIPDPGAESCGLEVRDVALVEAGLDARLGVRPIGP